MTCFEFYMGLCMQTLFGEADVAILKEATKPPKAVLLLEAQLYFAVSLVSRRVLRTLLALSASPVPANLLLTTRIYQYSFHQGGKYCP